MEPSLMPELMKKFASNVAIITSKDNAMTCAWITRASFSPAMVSIAIAKSRASYKSIQKSKEFGACICSTEQNVLASVAGSCSGKEVDKIKVLKELGFNFYKGNKIDCLMVKETILNMECKVVGEVEAGDHVVFVGEVINGKSNNGEPVLYAAGKYWGLGQQVMKPGQEVLDKINSLVEKNKK
jgi:flavin reductase (DIM6/NTAB) family NADH-FMN oxidoreductase RutF